MVEMIVWSSEWGESLAGNQSETTKQPNQTFLDIVSVYRDSAKSIENSWNFTGPTSWLEFLIV